MPGKRPRRRREWATATPEEQHERRMALLRELAIVGPSTPERIIQRLGDQFAAACGWEWHHNPDSRMVTSGFPDSVYLAPPFLFFVEYKSAKGTVRPDQATWVAKINEVPSPLDGGVRAFLIRPDKVMTLAQILWKHGPLSHTLAWPTHLHQSHQTAERTDRASSEENSTPTKRSRQVRKGRQGG